jgi:NTP pyrophosphatase (non-canonical NTP hydrolase)
MNDQPTTRHQVLRIILDWAHPDGDGDKAAELIDAIYREATPMTDQPTRGWLVACPWCGEATGSWPVSAQMAHLIEHGDALRERNAALEGERDQLREEGEALAQAAVYADRPYTEIKAERTRQEMLRAAGKFLHTCASPDWSAFTHFGRVVVLGEEYGEVCRAALDVEKIAEGRGDPDAARKKLRTELIQVAAVAVAYIEALDADGH